MMIVSHQGQDCDEMMSSTVEEALGVPEVKLPEPSDTMNFSKQATRNPGKFNLPKHRKPKLKRKLVQKNSKKRHECGSKKKNENCKLSRKRVHKGKFFTSSYKRRKKEHQVIIPPTKFLLGGNICDPLNLNSLQDEETNRAMNAATPISSPRPTPKHRHGEVEVIIPRNMKDPLNLISCADDNEFEVDSKLSGKRSRKHRHRKRKRGSSGSGSGKDESSEVIFSNIQDENVEPRLEAPPAKVAKVDRVSEKLAECAAAEKPAEKPPEEPGKSANQKRDLLSLNIKDNPRHSGHRTRKLDDKDKIVSPVIPQPGAWKKPRLSNQVPANRKKRDDKVPEFKPKNAKYQYGNYDRYYGYRNPHHELDVRLKCLIDHKELFFDKDILDIGCNIGHITLCVARDFGARSAVGLDIDRKLINIARKNVKHYVNCAPTPAYSGGYSIRNAPPFESPMYYDSKKNYYVFQDSPVMNPRATPLYSYPESPINRPSHQYCMESPSYTPSAKNTPYYSMESPSYHPSISESPSYRRNYAFESPSYVQQSPSYHSGRNTPLYSLESPSYQSHCSLDQQKRSPQDAAPAPAPTPAPAPDSTNRNPDQLFPISMPILYGPVDPPGISTQQDSNNPKVFPHNVTFVQGNYVLDSDVLLSTETPQFDVILALSITKWIHLNWGDAGMKQAFRRMFAQLRPGGILILESQAWPSYKNKKNLTKTIYHNYHSIEFMPEHFTQYLLSPEVGFSKVEVIGTPLHRSKGFQRPIQLFTKPGSTPSRSNTPMSRSTPSQVRYTPYSQRMCVRRPVYTALTVSSHDMDEDVSLSPKQTLPEPPGDGGPPPRVKFSPTSAEPCGTRSDASEGPDLEATEAEGDRKQDQQQ